ncbi:homocysteine S-methyltransferase family protein (plasmid) [Shinella sp. H4-D48]|uniref:homocysteine S-methyltransferase family protein n=1 Tax=Shinella sp. H4-D48 TaxID=2925841 RepID=UPI001F539105|nr:homocysteine S-methyltransferase family protein [Shinella sp. H4-D48]UNK40592.1 homocysteine S-methyltransferase family protein [Shinella sp. H4-D48]
MTSITILDGGMSRELVRLGATLRQPEWSALALMENPEIVRRVHEEFIGAGADVITTNSYALVPFHIGETRFREEGRQLIALAGRLAREAADAAGDGRIRVAGSLPPIFGSYEPQLFDPDRVRDYLSVLVAELNSSVDVFLGETLSLIAEAEAVEQAVAATGKPFWISFTLQDEPGAEARPPVLRSGESVEEAARWIAGSNAAALLFNCSRPEVMQSALAVAGAVLTKSGRTVPLGVYANAFTTEEEGAANETLHAIRDDLSDDRYSSFACDWVESGATMIGGCCGVGASHIHRVKRRVSKD